eukprot:m.178709 g.178709  ORF g.178709 m.178709 type:complete len:352 (+) comp21424_c7_seq6:67-1122(+)
MLEEVDEGGYESDDLELEIRHIASGGIHHCFSLCKLPVPLRLRLTHVCEELVGFAFWAVDNVVRLIGKVLVVAVYCLTGSIIYAWYTLLAPFLRQQQGGVALILHAVLAHWLMLNILYNYFKGTTVHPGVPPVLTEDESRRANAAGFRYCKKCQKHKPARTHHCSVCRQCILGMDHHCPWMNQCIGHRNHRYFFLFMLYMWLGCVYVSSVTLAPFRLRLELRRTGHLRDVSMIAYSEILHQGSMLSYCFILTAAVVLALGLLLFWHVYLISTAQTTIDFYINTREKKDLQEQGLTFVNRHDFGLLRNWQRFLGLTRGRSVWAVLLPSSHHGPVGDGMTWDDATNCNPASIV